MMGNDGLAKRAAWIAIAGGVVQVIYGILAIFFPYASGTTYGWDEALWVLASIGMAGAVSGILLLGVGEPGCLKWSGGIAALTGILTRIVASVFTMAGSSWDPLPLILVSIFLILGGMTVLGIALVGDDRLPGWRAWTPIVVSVFGFIVAAIYSVSLFVHFILLGAWGLSWMLVAYVVMDYASEPSANGASADG